MRFLYTVMIFSLVGCSSPKGNKFDYNISQEPWVDAFKDKAFFACLKESYSNDTIFALIEKEDVFNPYDGLNLEALKLAKKTGSDIAKNIPPPAMCEGCTDKQNYYMATCLHYYASEELDSIAPEAYKRHLANQ